jgi:hypothetical protein
MCLEGNEAILVLDNLGISFDSYLLRSDCNRFSCLASRNRKLVFSNSLENDNAPLRNSNHSQYRHYSCFLDLLMERRSTKFTWNQILSHTCPLIVTGLEYLINAWKFKNAHSIAVLIFGLVYAIVNLIGTKVTGHWLYNIITWEDWFTLLSLVGCIVTLLGFFFLLTYISHKRNSAEDEGTIIVFNK